MSRIAKKRRLNAVEKQASDSSSFASFDSEESDHEVSDSPQGLDNGSEDFSINDSPGNDALLEDVEHDEDVEDSGLEEEAAGPNQSVMNGGNDGDRKPRETKKPARTMPSITKPRSNISRKSGLFDDQISELLAQLRPKRGNRVQAAEEALRDIKSILEALPARPPTTIVEAERDLIKNERVAIPFPDPRPPRDAQYKLEFQQPANINVTGSHAFVSQLRTGRVLSIDMVVQMPESLFQDKDYLDYRYFYRRSYYLACLASGIRKAASSKYKLEFVNHNGNPLQSALIVKSGDSSSHSGPSKWQICLIPFVYTSIFNDERLSPSKCSIRRGGVGEDSKKDATSLYNSSIQADRLITPYLKLVHSTITSCDSFKDACLLLKVWLRQRGLTGTLQCGGFGNFESTALLAILLSAGIVSPRYSAYQLFKATIQFVATKDCLRAPVVIGDSSPPPVAVANIPILFDAVRAHNLLYKMTQSSYKTLRSEARATIAMLGDGLSENFESAFIVRADSMNLKYDINVAIPNQLLSSKDTADHQVLESRQRLYGIISRGLGDRVTQVDIRSGPTSDWDLASARPPWRTKGETTVGLRLNMVTASRTIDHGPAAEKKKEAADFRKFWGERAELRRFKDGSILESVVWSAKDGEQALIIDIIQYLIERHFDSATVAGLRVLGGDVSRMISHGSGITAFTSAAETLKTLETEIRSLDDLPLTIRQISAAGSDTRFASILPPSQRRSSSSPIDVVLQFESSSRWPEDIHAVQRVKAAFLLKMASLLQSANASVTTRVGLENSSSPTLNQAFLDITYPSPHLTFRVRIHHEREVVILQNLLKSKTTPPPLRDEATLSLAHYKRTFLALPAHTASIAKLCTRFSALSPTIRLIKKWFASHHLSSHFPEPLIELFALRPFLRPYPYGVPSSAKTGLFRTLHWLGRWDWRADPLLLPPTSTSPSSSHPNGASSTTSSLADGPQTKQAWLTAARTRFSAWRALDPALNRVVLFAASEADPEGTLWTDVAHGGPIRVATGRMSDLARAASRVIEGDDESGEAMGRNGEGLFVSGVGEFDFRIWLGRGTFRVDGGRKGKGKGKGVEYKNLVVDGSEEEGFDAVGMFVEEVRSLYGSCVVLFYGGEGSEVIAGLWNPVVEKRAWKVGLPYSTVPVEEDGEIVARINKEGILSEIARLGGDMIERIERNEA